MSCVFKKEQEGQCGWNKENKKKGNKVQEIMGNQVMQGLRGHYEECDFSLRWYGKSL